MSSTAASRASLLNAMAALRADLAHPDGPRISTMRNHRFAILPYDPADELLLRAEAARLSDALVASGWSVISISLQRLLLARIEALPAERRDWITRMERRHAAIDPERAMHHLHTALAPLIEGPQGLAADCAQLIRGQVAERPELADRTLALIGRVGALYPFFKSSALLRHIDGETGNVPVVLLYPGERRGETGLSFMGVSDADNDYRPRIYS
jgi:hypothetical protein